MPGIGVTTGGEDGTGQSAEEGEPDYMLTTPLYYVNASPHMGSAYPTIAADALARFQRLQGRRVVFVTGTDEHGEKIALAAAANGRQPKEHCDLVAQDYRDLWHSLNISYDRFVRTTQMQHDKIVTEFFARVWDSGDIYRAEYEGLYCIACEEYKDEKELLEGNCCPIHRSACVSRKEDNFFFALSKYQSQLEELLRSNQDFVRPPFRKNEVMGWVSEGLRDFSISRAAVDWGIPVPADSKQTIYVWFDALLGYITGLLRDGDEATLEVATSRGWPAAVHIIGKDILRFHAVYWPAMLLSAGLPLPRSVFGHGFLTKDGLKMGKSLGNTLEPTELVASFGSDAVRYFFLKEIEFGKDGDFSRERFVSIVNANLANTIGNLLNRTLGLLKKNCGGALSADAASLRANHPLRALAAHSVGKAKEAFEALQFGAACEAVLALASGGNQYLDEQAPWAMFKRGESEAQAAALDLVAILEVTRILAVALSPVAPTTCQRIYLQLGYSDSDFRALSWKNTQWGGLKEGQLMAEAEPVFQRIEEPLLGEEGKDASPRPKAGPSRVKKGDKKVRLPTEETMKVSNLS